MDIRLSMTTLQLGLIIGGVVLVVGVIIYNWIQERRVRRKLAAAFTPDGEERFKPAGANDRDARVEPTLARATRGDDGDDRTSAVRETMVPENAPRRRDESPSELDDEADRFVPPIDFAPARDGDRIAQFAAGPSANSEAIPISPLGSRSAGSGGTAQLDPEAECIITLQPARPVAAGALAAGLHARLGKPLRWLGRAGPGMPWQVLTAETPGTFTEIAACLLLADRAGAVTRPLVDRFVRLVGEIAATLPAAFVPPDVQYETDRAEALDRICADLDVQIGLTVLKPGPGTIAGTRLRGVAEAAGFRLSDNGRFDWIQEDTGLVLYSLQNYRSEPFTADSLRMTSTPGAVFILDVPRVSDPVRVFDQMKLAAKRMTMTLDASLVDDNRRPLDDAALAAIRQQVQATAAALKEINVVPGSPRALALFGG
jgi:hypothetical protein